MVLGSNPAWGLSSDAQGHDGTWGVQAVENSCMPTLVLVNKQGLMSPPARDFVLSTVPERMRCEELHVLVFAFI